MNLLPFRVSPIPHAELANLILGLQPADPGLFLDVPLLHGLLTSDTSTQFSSRAWMLERKTYAAESWGSNLSTSPATLLAIYSFRWILQANSNVLQMIASGFTGIVLMSYSASSNRPHRQLLKHLLPLQHAGAAHVHMPKRAPHRNIGAQPRFDHKAVNLPTLPHHSQPGAAPEHAGNSELVRPEPGPSHPSKPVQPLLVELAPDQPGHHRVPGRDVSVRHTVEHLRSAAM